MADKLVIKVGANTDEFKKDLKSLGSFATSTFKGIAAATGAISTAVVAAGKQVLGVGASFESAMSEVQALSGATTAEFELLSNTAKEYGASTAFSASQAAEALKYMALAGYDAGQSVDALGGVLNLAAAGGMDLAQASDMITDYLSAFGLAAEKAGDMANKMAFAQANSNTSAEALGQAYGSCATNLHSAGQTMESVTAVLMGMANVGDKGAAAGTELSAIMASITQKADKGAITINKQKIAVQDATGNWRDMIDILADVEQATAGLGSMQKTAALSEVFNRTSLTAVNTIFGAGIENIRQYKQEISGVDDAYAENQASQMLDNLAGDVKILQSALEGLQLTAYDSVSGIAREAVQGVTEIVNSINDAFNNGFTADAMEGVLTQVFNLLGKVGTEFTRIMDSVVQSLTNIIPRLLPNIVKGVSTLMQSVTKQLPNLAKSLTAVLPDVITAIGDMIPSLIDGVMAGIQVLTENIVKNLPQILGSIVNALPKIIMSIVSGLGGTVISALKGLNIGEKFEYESYGDLSTELTYDVDIDARVEAKAAEEKITQKVESFVEDLKGYGLTAGQVAKVLAFSGTEEELRTYLAKNFPNLSEVQINAIVENMKLNTLESALANVTGEGGAKLTNEQIAKIIQFVSDDDMAGLETYLSTNCPDIKAAAIAAIQDNYLNSSTEISSGADGASIGLGVQLIVDMFTDGLADDPKEIETALATVKKQIDAKKQELIEYINGDGEDKEGAQEALTKLDELDAALVGYTTDYANKSTAECHAQGQVLAQMVQQANDATEAILGNTEKLKSYQQQLFEAGSAGSKLNKEDTTGAMSYIKAEAQGEITRAEEVKKELLKSGKTYEEAEQARLEIVEAAMATAKERMIQLMAGQAGEASPMLALSTLLGNILENDGGLDGLSNDLVTPEKVAEVLQNAGYNSDTIEQAMQLCFTDGGAFNPEGMYDLLNGFDFTELGNMVKTAIENGILDPKLFEGMDLDADMATIIQMLFAGGIEPVEIEGEPKVTATPEITVEEPKEGWTSEGMPVIDDEDAETVTIPVEATPEVSAGEVSGTDTVATAVETAVETDASEVTADVPVTLAVAVDDATSSGTAAGQDVVGGMTTAITDGAATVDTAAASTIASITSAESTATAAGKAIGGYAAAGMAAGLRDKTSAVVAAAKTLAASVAAAVRLTLQIHSPSRVMMELGQYTGQGFEEGITKSMNGAVAAARNIVGNMNLAPSLGFERLGESINGMTEAMAGDGANLYLNVNGKTLAQVTAGDNNTAINGYQRRIALGLGRG